jgi:hypothetical protein
LVTVYRPTHPLQEFSPARGFEASDSVRRSWMAAS